MSSIEGLIAESGNLLIYKMFFCWAECQDGVEGMGMCVLPFLLPGLDCLPLLLWEQN